MGTTLQKVKDDIASGKCKAIYYSSATGWWTHDFADVEQATVKGMIATELRSNKVLNDESIPAAERERVGQLNELRKNMPQIPLDPTGAPLLEANEPEKFIALAEQHKDRYGRRGLDAFMKSHHQNCGELYSDNWEEYNLAIDAILN